MFYLLLILLFIAAFFSLFTLWLFIWSFMMSGPDSIFSEQALVRQTS